MVALRTLTDLKGGRPATVLQSVQRRNAAWLWVWTVDCHAMADRAAFL